MRLAWALGTIAMLGIGAPNAAFAANQNCRGISDPTQRLACYDAREDKEQRRGEDKAARQKENFGLSEKQKEPEDRNEVEAISAKIVKVGGTRLYLDNDAVWELARDSRIINWIRPGQEVTIKKGMVGGYRAVVSGVSGREAVTRLR